MSKKPYIKIVYPDASPIAMLLTEAMVRRASGKRVVETESAEREHAGQDLFAGTLCCVTETSVELTLNLAPEAMDFALATLIARNLTQPERDQAIAASDSLELDALFAPRAQAAEAPGQALDGDSSADVPSAERETATQSREQEKQIEIGKISEIALRDILTKLVINYETADPDSIEPFDIAIAEIKHAAGASACTEEVGTLREPTEEAEEKEMPSLCYKTLAVFGAILSTTERIPRRKKKQSDVNFLRDLCEIAMQHLVENLDETEASFFHAKAEADKILYGIPLGSFDPERVVLNLTKILYDEDHGIQQKEQETTWDDVEKEAQSLGKDKADKADKAEEEQDGEIEPGLLNDLDTQMEGAEE